MVEVTKGEIYRKILYLYFQDYIYGLPQEDKRKFIERGFFLKLRSILVTLALTVKRNSQVLNAETERKLRSHGRWVFCYGKNNYDAAEFLEGLGFVFVSDSVRRFAARHPILILPVTIRWRHYLRFFYLFLYLLKHEGRKSWLAIDAIFSSIGWYEGFIELLEKYGPRVIVFSNDHSIVPRALFWAAKEKGIPTIYIQHASISRYMPPLDFDLSLLEGTDALEKYKRKGIFGTVRLIGMPKFDAHVLKRRQVCSKTIKLIGIPFNTADSLSRISEFITFLHSRTEQSFILRPHPKDTRDMSLLARATSDRIRLSDPKAESPFDFILKCDLIIAGDTSIHLEAKMLNVESIYYNFTEQTGSTYDLYEYISKGFVCEFKELESVLRFLKENRCADRVYEKTQYYNFVIDTPNEANASGLATEAILKFLSGF